MPRITNKAYDQLLKNIGELIAGALKHSSNPRIAANLNAKDLEDLKAELTFLRLDYLQKEKQAREAYENFNMKFRLAQKRVSNDCRIIKGVLDPRADELSDFGIMPERSKTKTQAMSL